ncbi:DUF4097 family beta strand repeat-containing protein [Sediminivirga luteola]|uniref:Adhesin domain-containing protein n=2 Tax=Sediminivirga luteola TaxID=1774748 RepID=A0A8J2XJC7_9MICO|nr:hypothetical protein [Sediminivirga luteola]GGA05200.1 hypothetical protein GCM10011333_04940 [Sediminivirga luteola]
MNENETAQTTPQHRPAGPAALPAPPRYAPEPAGTGATRVLDPAGVPHSGLATTPTQALTGQTQELTGQTQVLDADAGLPDPVLAPAAAPGAPMRAAAAEEGPGTPAPGTGHPGASGPALAGAPGPHGPGTPGQAPLGHTPANPIAGQLPGAPGGSGGSGVPGGTGGFGGPGGPQHPGGPGGPGGPQGPAAGPPPGDREPPYTQGRPTVLEQSSGGRAGMRALVATISVLTVLIILAVTAVATTIALMIRADTAREVLPTGTESLSVDAGTAQVIVTQGQGSQPVAELRSVGFARSTATMAVQADGPVTRVVIDGPDVSDPAGRHSERILWLRLPEDFRNGLDLDITGERGAIGIAGTGFGDVRVEGSGAHIGLHEGSAANVELSNETGPVTVNRFELTGSLTVSAGRDIDVELDPTILPTGPIELTADGDVTLLVPDFGDPALYRIDAEVASGELRNRLSERGGGGAEPPEGAEPVRIVIDAYNAIVSYTGDEDPWADDYWDGAWEDDESWDEQGSARWG